MQLDYIIKSIVINNYANMAVAFWSEASKDLRRETKPA